jgi:hypothetical protein
MPSVRASMKYANLRIRVTLSAECQTFHLAYRARAISNRAFLVLAMQAGYGLSAILNPLDRELMGLLYATTRTARRGTNTLAWSISAPIAKVNSAATRDKKNFTHALTHAAGVSRNKTGGHNASIQDNFGRRLRPEGQDHSGARSGNP